MSIIKHVNLQTIVAHDFRYVRRICKHHSNYYCNKESKLFIPKGFVRNVEIASFLSLCKSRLCSVDDENRLSNILRRRVSEWLSFEDFYVKS